MLVRKANGEKEEFDERKIISTCLRAGADEALAEQIAENIKNNMHAGASTHDIYKMITAELDRQEDKSSLLFRLREAVARLDSVSFELYTKKILESDGYTCKWNEIIQGMYVQHQVDLIAQKALPGGGNELFLVECKRHINPHRYTGLNIPLQVQARLEDVQDGFEVKKNGYRFDGAWIVTNGKFSEHAKAYAAGKAIRLTGWKYQDGYSLERLIHGRNMFPVTLLKTEARQLVSEGILTIHDLLKSERYAHLHGEARKLL